MPSARRVGVDDHLMFTPQLSTDSSPSGSLTSVAFWLSLFLAAGLYATVALSARILDYLTLERENLANQWQLVGLERDDARLQKVIEAQKNDPAFAREQARADFEVARSDEQRIPVDPRLMLNLIGNQPADPVVPPRGFPWYAAILNLVAGSHRIGNVLLAAAASLVIYAFAFLDGRCDSRVVDVSPPDPSGSG